MLRTSDRITDKPVLASALSVLAACVGGTVGFGLMANLQSALPNPPALVILAGLLFAPVGILLGGLPALGVLLGFVWPSLLILNRGLKLKGRIAVGVTWLVAMGLMAAFALIPSGGEHPTWHFLLTPMLGTSAGTLVMVGFASGPREAELDIAGWRD